MPKKYLVGLLAALVLALAVWLVPMALAAGNTTPTPKSSSSSGTPSQGSGTTHRCDGNGQSSGTTSSFQTY